MTHGAAPHDHHDDHPEGLHEDLRKIASRRDALRIFGGAGLATILASCGGSSVTTLAGAATPTSEVPDETAGPYPGDGSNGPNVLDDSGIVRHDIRTSFGTSSGTATGIPLRVNLTVTDASKDYAPMAGAAVYLWHCDRAGRYSMYSSGVTDQNYLRGVVQTDEDGTAWFKTVFPGCYSGRWPHIHFEVYSSVANAVRSGPIVKTSQIALPKATCAKVYAKSSYASSRRNLANISLASDNVFRDDKAIHQLATVTGNATKGFVANLTIGV
ncbi:MAG: intradiol ring-cleavage dioxygenase [Patulibacter minatonensis]